jgi:hypothetical protein
MVMKKLQNSISHRLGYKRVGRYSPIGQPWQLVQRSEFIRDLGNSSRQNQLIQREQKDANAKTDKDERETESTERDRDFFFCGFRCHGRLIKLMYACASKRTRSGTSLKRCASDLLP